MTIKDAIDALSRPAFTESTNTKFYENLMGITLTLESKGDFSSFGGKEHAIQRRLQFHFMTDQMRVRIVNELKEELTSRFNSDQLDVVSEAFKDLDMIPDWLWG